MKLSIIIPVYNAEKYLRACLDSCLDQSPYRIGGDYEILCINDGSKDGSLKILEKYEAKGVRHISQENQGVSAARNNGLRNAKGDYIWFVDSDDLIHPQEINQIVDQLEKEQSIGCTICHIGVPEDYKIENPQKYRLSFERCVRGINNPVSIVVNREYVLFHKLFFNTNMAYGEDTLWVYFLQLYSDNFIDTDAVLYYYRQSPTSAMHQHNETAHKKWLDSMQVMLDEYQKVLRNWPDDAVESKHQETRDRVLWTTQNIIFGALRCHCLDEILPQLKQNGLYPYPILWKRLFKNSKSLGTLKTNAFGLLFPCTWYLRLIQKTNKRIHLI